MHMKYSEYDEIFGLNTNQTKAIHSLERALKKCKKEGVYIHNCYGQFRAFNSVYVTHVDDIEEEYNTTIIPCYCGKQLEMDDLNEWADDEHFVHLSEKGKIKLKKYYEE